MYRTPSVLSSATIVAGLGYAPANRAGDTFSGTVNFNPNTPSTPSTAQAMTSLQSASGTITGPLALNNFKIYFDQINAANGAGTDFFVEGFVFSHYVGGSTVRGGRNNLSTYLYLTAPTNAANNNRNYVGASFGGIALSGDGGTNTGAGSLGAVFGMGATGVAQNGATNLANVTGAEFNIAMQTGSSVNAKSIIQLSGRTDDAVQGAVTDTMIWLYNQSASTPKFTYGILFGVNAYPFNSSSTVLGLVGTGTIGTGIDLSTATVATAAFKSPGFTVDGSGNVTPNTVKLLPITAPANPASGWVLYDDTATGRVTFKAASGANVQIFDTAGSGGIIVGNAAALITSSVTMNNGAAAQTATLTNGPTAGNPTKWVPFNDNGTTRYIPAW